MKNNKTLGYYKINKDVELELIKINLKRLTGIHKTFKADCIYFDNNRKESRVIMLWHHDYNSPVINF